jgi:hypothetical protein
VLVELGVVEQRYRAVLEVLDEGAAVTDVARRVPLQNHRRVSDLEIHEISYAAR